MRSLYSEIELSHFFFFHLFISLALPCFVSLCFALFCFCVAFCFFVSFMAVCSSTEMLKRNSSVGKVYAFLCVFHCVSTTQTRKRVPVTIRSCFHAMPCHAIAMLCASHGNPTNYFHCSIHQRSNRNHATISVEFIHPKLFRTNRIFLKCSVAVFLVGWSFFC